ncbi:efflux RND transporter periplasmic adaptor subunit [Ramlibacter sp. AN1015]|uniref:efflux RND transporter periplasmic adaptor subunit n=1 Tax=Ramlibacter sp. AN1015 TaxID=3133428 RepID=UPI0030C1AA52
MFRATVLAFVYALSMALGLGACSKPEPAPEPVQAVKVLTVGATALSGAAEFAADVRPRIESRLAFRVPGKIVQRQADAGQRVRAGQVLAQLDGEDLRLASEAARAQLAAATTQRDLAAADFGRYTALRQQNFISGAELERRESTLRAAQAQLEQAQAQFAVQGNQAGYAQLRAPAAGVVTAVEAEPGQVVAAGAPVLRLALDGPRDAVFALPEGQLELVARGMPVAIRAWSQPQPSLTGRVREIAARADPVTRTFEVKVPIDGTAPPLGSTVYVTPRPQAHTAPAVLKLPTSALRRDAGAGQGSAVWVLDRATMTVRLQPVQVATVDGNDAVIAAGLEPGMEVVAAGVHVLTDGQQVTVWQARP